MIVLNVLSLAMRDRLDVSGAEVGECLLVGWGIEIGLASSLAWLDGVEHHTSS